MTKRVISGVFLLVALGALGLILAGALTSGEQLIVRFLTAIIVAALALYVISDLRLQADDSAMARRSRNGGPTPAPARVASGNGRNSDAPPPNSTAAFMATVTGKRSAIPPSVLHGGEPVSPSDAPATVEAAPSALATATATATADTAVMGIDAGRAHVGTAAAERNGWADDRSTGGEERLSPLASPGIGIDLDDLLRTPYEQDDDDEVTRWPLTAEFRAITEQDLADDDTTVDTNDGDDTTPDDAADKDLRPGPLDRARDRSQDRPDQVPTLPWTSIPDPTPEPAMASSGYDDPVASSGTSRALTDLPRAESPFGRLSTGTALGLLDRPGSAAALDAGDALDNGVVARDVATATIAAATYARSPRPDVVDLHPQPIAAPTEIESAIRKGELDIIASLIEQGLLSTNGPISDRDVRTMVYVAFTSAELRKILLAGGTVDSDHSNLDLGEVEVFTSDEAPLRGALPPAPPADDVIDLRDPVVATAPIEPPSRPISVQHG